jgi:hypothetical protein
MRKHDREVEILLWNIALPGFGQLLNGKYVKGILFISMEILINVQSHMNEIIVSSFQGEINLAIEQANYQWLMFYPCLYMFAMWDGYRDVKGAKTSYSFLPFVFAAFSVTIGVIYSSKLRIFGVLLGPIWLPILFLPLGLGIGLVTKIILLNFYRIED